MDTQGFRPPQFSEDLAWAPGWVQNQVEQFGECIKEPLGFSKLASKDLASFQGNMCREKDVILLSREEGRYNRYYLFASGEDNASMSCTSSHGNVLQFHLHLSSDGHAQCGSSQLLASDSSQAVSEIIPSVQQLENPIALKENTLCKTSCNAVGSDMLPRNSKAEPRPQYPKDSKDSLRHNGEFSARHLKDAEINDAVKLSIAASEALVLHEIANSRSVIELVATDLLEVALQVKQARLEWLEDAFDCSTKETDEHDSLSDLDDFAMTEAFEDVGLTCNSYDLHVNCSISHVKETPASENHYRLKNHSDSVNLWDQQVNFDDIFTQNQFENNLNLDAVQRVDLPSESLSCERQKKTFDGPISCSNTTTMANKKDSSTPKNPCVVDVAQMVGSSMVDLTSPQPQTKEHIATHDWKLEDAREDRVKYLVSERFRSRWLGGWTTKIKSHGESQSKLNNVKSIMKAFAGETSFLSESADIVPDVNSLVQIGEIKSHGESQSSIIFEGLHDKANEGILISQDVVKSSNLSLADPLCSVVPCSISLEDTKSVEVQNQNNMKTDAERPIGPTVELEIRNSCHLASLNVESQCGKEQVMEMVNEASKGIVRRKLTSLKTYSMIFPKNVSTSDMRTVHHNQSFESQFNWDPCKDLAFNQNTSCISGSDKRRSKQLLFFNSICNCFAGKENEEICGTMMNGNSIEKLKRKKKTNRNAGDGDGSPVHSVKGKLQVSRPSIINYCGEEHPKQASQLEHVIKFQQSKRIQRIEFDSKNSHDRQFPARKRVRFSEAEVQIKPNKNFQELHSSKRNCSVMAASKKQKYIDVWSHYRSGKGFLGCCSQAAKGLIFQGIRFLLTGFSSQKTKDIKQQIQKHGGIILSDIPSPPNARRKRWSRSNWYQLPIILSSKKVLSHVSQQQTTKFLYGCAVTALILNIDWITDSVGAGSILAPEKYMILPWQDAKTSSIEKQEHYDNSNSIFNCVGIMLHGKRNFCTKLSKIVKHGGGRVFKTLHWLVHSLDKKQICVGAIVTEDENMASRHLRQCASERQIPMMNEDYSSSLSSFRMRFQFPKNQLKKYQSAAQSCLRGLKVVMLLAFHRDGFCYGILSWYGTGGTR
ncbi:BRCT domain containing protein [Trema orientale]|uniref:BRCT domain containing protein n=1 Tax=Trema orientale TaxID=63057 RepID=A0A2P5FIC9_TREOI|nr:BRCT domain containing protein [Trema orientale]